MTDSTSPESRASAPHPDDDLVLPFRIEGAGASGRIIRLGHAVDTILTRHDYPPPVSRLLAEAVTLAALLGATIKHDGRFILQTQTDGPVNLLVADYSAPGDLRGYAEFDTQAFAREDRPTEGASGALLGSGHMAMTIDPGPGMERYQGIIALENASLANAANHYFQQSEQLPAYLQLAVAQHYAGSAGSDEPQWHWRAGGIVVQHLSSEGGHEVSSPSDDMALSDPMDAEDWNRVHMLAATTQDHELTDPALMPEQVLYRLFHEDGVRVFAAKRFEPKCRCSQAHIAQVLNGLSEDEIDDMADDGALEVTCQFCNTRYRFDRDELAPEGK